MKLTHAMLESGKSERGGWNGAQLKVLGVEWPPKKGWPSRLIGTEISATDYEKFLELRKAKRVKIGPPKRAPKEHDELFHKEDAETFANNLFEESGRDLA